ASWWRCAEYPNARRASSGSRRFAMASAMCDCNSSSMSRLKRSPRKTFAMRDQSDMSDRPQNAIDCRSHRLPARLFGTQLFLARRCEFIDASPPPALFLDPFGVNPAGFLHAMQSRVKRAFLGTEHFAGHRLDGGHDGVPMEARAAGKDLQYE